MREIDDLEYKPHPLGWVVEKLRLEPSYMERPMFGCRACYLNGELKLVLAALDEEPWNGVLIATSKEQHAVLFRDFQNLTQHPILGKWLYLSESHVEFEMTCQRIITAILKGDQRIGVLPKRRASKRKKSKHLKL